MQLAPLYHSPRSKYLVLTRDFFVPFLICLSVIISIIILLRAPVFQIQSITCTLDFAPCPSGPVLAQIEQVKGSNIFLFRPSDLIRRLESGDFTIAHASLTRQLPGSLSLSLESVYPSVAIHLAGDPTWVVFDAKSRVIGVRLVDPNVPVVELSSPLTLTVGQIPEDSTLLTSLDLAQTLGQKLASFKSLTLESDGALSLRLDGGLRAIFSPHKDVLAQVAALQAILTSDTIKEGVRVIDLRFDQPVLSP